ncbi:MAG: hypothetical protein K2X71_15590 [Methylobacterium sp.]|uniref:hypothetical protein n=1 Tax=Methylobacterium sp. TaxID=409 RepID=UPI002589DAAB|nr:hypothetical protein [Methylobacterium sp.]MBY0297437.1 hypothetical protein [Methylobacterium sp.]
MADPVTSLDSWPAIAIAVTAAIAAALVPLNGFVKTLLDYRLEAKKAEALKPDGEVIKHFAQSSGPALLEAVLITDLTTAVKELTAQIKALQASEEAAHNSRLDALTAQLAEALRRWESGPPQQIPKGWGR